MRQGGAPRAGGVRRTCRAIIRIGRVGKALNNGAKPAVSAPGAIVAGAIAAGRLAPTGAGLTDAGLNDH
ncbi:MAG: hypothetical protein H7242_13145 [Microbacteriaceae bacterium]|nr:hypothetical protein [Burkholderiaceae bacterium]